MDRLTSCYFCGDAFDASLSEYPVVPKELQPPDESPTVVLCGDCRGKLGAVVEEVVSAAREGGSTESDGSAKQDDATAGGQRDAVAAGGDEPAGTAATNGTESADAADLFGEADGETATDADEWESPVTDDSAREETTATTASDDTSTDDSTREETKTATTASDDTSTDDSGEENPTLTKLEYNKVMRLLKNRPFPVDRAEIREVATSAYEISPAEFDAVIEAAVERDLIAVENGQFVDPT